MAQTARNGKKVIPPQPCLYCGNMKTLAHWERPSEYSKRMFCSRNCSAKSRAVPIADRINNYTAVNVVTGCIEWQAHRDKKGYGRTGPVDGDVLTHRVVWAAAMGKIPDGMHVLHHCDNPPCCNVKHLYLGTNADNMRDKTNRGRARGLPGESNPKAKLCEEDVAAIRVSSDSTSDLMAFYTVSRCTINRVRRRAGWTNVA